MTVCNFSSNLLSCSTGSIYEPPLMNVFTMQWFLTMFCNCLPHSTVLRVWDLIFLEGNQMLLKTALAIWDTLSEYVGCMHIALSQITAIFLPAAIFLLRFIMLPVRVLSIQSYYAGEERR